MNKHVCSFSFRVCVCPLRLVIYMLNFNIPKVAYWKECCVRSVRVPFFFFFLFFRSGSFLSAQVVPLTMRLHPLPYIFFPALEFHIYNLFHVLNSDSMSTFILSGSYLHKFISHQTDQFLEAFFFLSPFLSFFFFSVSNSVFDIPIASDSKIMATLANYTL